MRILILSDLHLEHWHDASPLHCPDPAPDVVVLAGDIWTASHAVPWAAKTFPGIPVLYIAGNHESYGFHLGLTEAALHTHCTLYPDVRFLQMGEYIQAGVRFLGCTLWTDFALFGQDRQIYHAMAVQRGLNDYRAITTDQDDRLLRASDTMDINSAHVAWLKAKLDEPFAGKTVVITHHAPSMRSVPEQYKREPLTAGFASNFDDLVAQANVWIHGHTHTSMDYQVEACRVVCNPRGYPRPGHVPENRAFDPAFIIEVTP